MQKIGVLLIAVAAIGFANAQNCDNYPTLLELNKCCFGIIRTTFDEAFDSCLADYKAQNIPHPEYCASPCAFVKTEMVYPNGTIDYTGLEALLNSQVKVPRLVEHMLRIVHGCDAQVARMMQTYTVDPADKCIPAGYLMQRCSASHAILDCPVDFWQMDNPECKEILEAARACPFNY